MDPIIILRITILAAALALAWLEFSARKRPDHKALQREVALPVDNRLIQFQTAIQRPVCTPRVRQEAKTNTPFAVRWSVP